MNKFTSGNNVQILKFSVVLILICFVSILLFTLPAFTKYFDLSEENGIGSSIGGITAPIIGIASSILLYLALTKQTESNIEQKLKNDSDIIFLLLNQLNTEYDNFYFKLKINSVDTKYSGLEGLTEFSKRMNGIFNFDNLKANSKTFRTFYESGQIVLIVESINLINNRVEQSQLSREMKELFSFKLKLFYEAKLKDSLTNLYECFEKNEFLKDDWTEKIVNIVEKYK
jgi:hypothetical protein